MRVESSILRKLNGRRVLNAIRVGGPVSRSDIQRRLDMAPPTVSRIIDDLIAQGWVREVGRGDFTLGRPPVMLEINRDSVVAVGVDIGRTHIRTVCVNLLAEVLRDEEIPLGDIYTADSFVQYLKQTLHAFDVEPSKIIGIGLAAPGSRNPHPDAPQRLGEERYQEIHHHWHHDALEERIQRSLGVQAWMENDANAAVLGEMWFGIGQDARHLVYVLADEGLGAGIAVNGSIYTGEDNVAGEFAHMIVDVSGNLDCACGLKGCIGAIAHVQGIRTTLRLAGAPSTVPLQHIYALAKTGHEPQASVVSRTFDYLSIGIVNVVQIINPSKVILGGNLFWADSFAVEEVIRRVKGLSNPKYIEVVPSGFGVNAVAVGAATLVLQNVYDHTILVRLPSTPISIDQSTP